MRSLVLSTWLLLSSSAWAGAADTHQAASELVRTMHLGEQMRALIPSLIENFAATRPDDPTFRTVMQAFFDKYFTAAELEARIVDIYADTFTEKELKAYVKFYKTPAGQKLVSKSAELSSRGMEVGRQVVADHKADLLRMIQEAQAQ